MGDGLVTFGALVSVTYILGIGLSVGMKQISEPRCLVRFYSIDTAAGMRFAMIWTPIFLGVSLICVMGLGALVHGMADDSEAAALIANTDQVVGFMLAKFDNSAVSAFCITGLFAAGMSSLASVMLIVGTAAVGDIRNLWVRSDPRSTVRWTRVAIVVYSGVVGLVTLFPPAGVVELTSFSGAVFAAGFFPAVFGGLYLRWGTGHGGVLVNARRHGGHAGVAVRRAVQRRGDARRARDHPGVLPFAGGLCRGEPHDSPAPPARGSCGASLRRLSGRCAAASGSCRRGAAASWRGSEPGLAESPPPGPRRPRTGQAAHYAGCSSPRGAEGFLAADCAAPRTGPAPPVGTGNAPPERGPGLPYTWESDSRWHSRSSTCTAIRIIPFSTVPAIFRG